MDNPKMQLELHTHNFTSGPRSSAGYRNGKWEEPKITHSHPGGGIPHTHPNMGPSFYGYRKPETRTRPTGEQFQWVALSEEQQTFELVITDSAKLSGEFPIGDTPLNQMTMPAAERIKTGFRMRCIVRDERAVNRG